MTEEGTVVTGKNGWVGALARVLLCGWMACCALVASATEFSVGRVEVMFAEADWKELPLPDSESVYGGDKDGSLRVESKLFVRASPDGEGQMLVLVSATEGGMGGAYMSYSPTCESDADDYREGNTGVRRSFAQCLIVLPPYTGDSVIKVLAPEIVGLSASGVVSVQGPLYSVISRHAISTGVSLDVRVFTTLPIAVPAATVKEALPKGVLPEHVVWGRLLKDAVKSSVYSLSGRLDVPALSLVPASPKGARSLAMTD